MPDDLPTWINTGRTPRRISLGLKTRLLIRASQRGRGIAVSLLLGKGPEAAIDAVGRIVHLGWRSERGHKPPRGSSPRISEDEVPPKGRFTKAMAAGGRQRTDPARSRGMRPRPRESRHTVSPGRRGGPASPLQRVSLPSADPPS